MSVVLANNEISKMGTTSTGTSSSMGGITDAEGMNGGRKRRLRKMRYDSLEEIRSIYRRATKAFLLNHHRQVWHSLSLGLDRIHSLLLIPTAAVDPPSPTTTTPWWLVSSTLTGPSACVDWTIDLELHQLARKFHILRITFLTAILPNSGLVESLIGPSSSSLADSMELSASQQAALSGFLRLNAEPAKFLCRLLTAVGREEEQQQQPGPDAEPDGLLLPTADDLRQMHPSILTAMGLASIKLGERQTGKTLIERWFSAVESLDLCFVTQPLPPSRQHLHLSPRALSSDLRLSYQNLIQIYAIHILGPLDLWPFAIDFILSHQAADILPVETVQNIIHAIKTARAQQEQLVKHSKQRQQQRREEKKVRQGAVQQQ